MKKTAKIISLAITLVMILSIVVTLAINAGAASAPSFGLVTQKVDDNTISVTVNLESGGFNAFNGGFNTSDGVKCTSIKQGNTWKNFKDAEEDSNKPVAFVSNPANGKVGCSNVSVFENKGDFIVATFDVDPSKDYSISFDTEVCKVEDSDVSSAVKSVKYEYKPGSAAYPTEPTNPTNPTKPTNPTNTEKSTDPTKTTKPTNSTTTKPSTKTVIVTQIVPVTQSNGQAVTDANGQPATTVITESSVVNVDEAIVDESVDGESPEYADTFGYDFSTTTTVKADGSKLISNSHINPKIIIPVGIALAVIIAGIVTALILVKKRGENGAETAAVSDDFTDSFEPFEDDETDIEDFSNDSDYDVTDFDE